MITIFILDINCNFRVTDFEDVSIIFSEVESKALLDIIRQFFYVIFISEREDKSLHTFPLSGHDLLFDSSNGKHLQIKIKFIYFSSQADFTSHGEILGDGFIKSQADQGSGDGDACGRAVLSDCAFCKVDVDVVFIKESFDEFFSVDEVLGEISVNEVFGVRKTDVAAFTHNLADIACEVILTGCLFRKVGFTCLYVKNCSSVIVVPEANGNSLRNLIVNSL